MSTVKRIQRAPVRPADRDENADAPSAAEAYRAAAIAARAAQQKDQGRLGAASRLSTLAWFTRQLYVLLIGGMPLLQALRSLELQAKEGRWRRTLHRIKERVEEGASLSEALTHEPAYFDPVFVNLIAAGEASGSLNEILSRLSALTKQMLQTRRAVVTAMTYPVLLTFISTSALLAMVLIVLPQFEGLFETLDMPIPPTTKYLLVLSAVIRGAWVAWLIGVLAAAVGLWFGLRSARGRRMIDYAALRTPRIGPIVRNFATARIARLLGVLVGAKVPLLEALRLVRLAMSNSYYVALLTQAEEAVAQGRSVSDSLADPMLVSPSVTEALRSGEESGQIGPLLLEIASFLDSENEDSVRQLTGVIEPMILTFLGLMVGFVAISLFLPLFDLTAMTSPGGGG